MTPAEILHAIAENEPHIAVVGDALSDEYVFGRVERICPEAPVPVFIPEHTEARPGGAANVVRQLEALHCTVYRAFAADRGTKLRYVAGQQLVLRVDRDKFARPDARDVHGVSEYIRHLPFLDALILSDYNKGWLTPDMCQSAIKEAVLRNADVVVDPKGTDWAKYVGCSLICPNEKEHVTAGIWTASTFPDILLKRGARGMQLHSCAKDYGRVAASITDIPTTARHVYDVTGAGDTVVAVVTAAIAVGASQLQAASLAAVAAGYVVGEVGTTVCTLEKLKELIDANPNP